MSNIEFNKYCLIGKILGVLCIVAGLNVHLNSAVASAESYQNPIRKPVSNKIGDRTVQATQAQNVEPVAYCRFGVNLSTLRNDETSNLANYDLPALGTGWFIDYQARSNPPRSDEIDYLPMIRIQANDGAKPYRFSPSGDNLWIAIQANIGADWFIGNEPDRKKFQDGVTPEVYAAAYHEVYHIIKRIDPTAKIFAGSIVQPTEVRLEYLDAILASYQSQFGELLPVDGWSIHNFILNEADCDAFGNDLSVCWGADMPPATDKTEGLRIGIEQHHDIAIFKKQVERFRQWMATNGYRGMPVYLSEYGVLLPDWYRPTADFSAAAINQYMSASFDYMLTTKDTEVGDPHDDYRLVQRFSWYSVNDDYRQGGQYNGNLFSPATFNESDMGRNYREYTESLPNEVNIYVSDVDFMPEVGAGMVPTATEPVTYTIRMTIANSGNLLKESVGTISLYDRAPNQGGQQIIEDFDVELAGCGEYIVVEKEWVVLPEDIDIPANITTADLAASSVIVSYGKINTYMPLISKQ